MGVDGSKGSLREGFDADIVIFDNDVNVSEVIVGGKLIVASFIQDCLFAS
jgi:N-acetylglucosamine-6-phosphate deacetylase